ncbi:uncharacterized protein LOC131941911 isoform X2 [Physella acuta]|uniref:uncharacterized protein LOC131941911 isoform X2 n=1 Tax=Physella acuta TaxID=109671 RepID=UPI0027DBC8E3|nr:uncharacterized protein LOC131941911 isoform X2 [Physella acuta]
MAKLILSVAVLFLCGALVAGERDVRSLALLESLLGSATGGSTPPPSPLKTLYDSLIAKLKADPFYSTLVSRIAPENYSTYLPLIQTALNRNPELAAVVTQLKALG